jgi:hypothetical protein
VTVTATINREDGEARDDREETNVIVFVVVAGFALFAIGRDH